MSWDWNYLLNCRLEYKDDPFVLEMLDHIEDLQQKLDEVVGLCE